MKARKSMARKSMVWKWILWLGVCMLLSSCSLLPQEEVLPQAPLIREYTQQTFQTAQVVREDMSLTENIRCTYLPMQSETLCYAVDGEYFGEVFVQVGERVEAGQLVAQLDVTDIQQKKDACQVTLDKLGVRIAAIEENRKLAIERERILGKKRTSAETSEAIRQVNAQYDQMKRAALDEMQVAQLQMAEYEQELTQRQLYAGISGTVTYVRRTTAGAKSSSGEKFITIANVDICLFRASTPYAHLFKVGQEWNIAMGNTMYEAVVVDASQLNLDTAKENAQSVYFRLKYPMVELKEGSQGTVSLLLDARENVLTLPERAVSTINGQAVVYYTDDMGMKAYKTVEIGLKANGRVEILSGLTEGESVIVE